MQMSLTKLSIVQYVPNWHRYMSARRQTLLSS